MAAIEGLDGLVNPRQLLEAPMPWAHQKGDEDDRDAVRPLAQMTFVVFFAASNVARDHYGANLDLLIDARLPRLQQQFTTADQWTDALVERDRLSA